MSKRNPASVLELAIVEFLRTGSPPVGRLDLCIRDKEAKSLPGREAMMERDIVYVRNAIENLRAALAEYDKIGSHY